MSIDLPIKLEFDRPLEAPDTPYRQCDTCQHIAIPNGPDACCAGCGGAPADRIWPEPELIELWHDEVFCWNHKKAELATVVAAMYFEASVFMLIFWRAYLLDPDLKCIGAPFAELKNRRVRIQKYLLMIRSPKATEKAIKKLFGVRRQEMLETVLKGDASRFWATYEGCREWRNRIIHRGKRIYYETLADRMRPRNVSARDRALCASLQFIPRCWVVFSRLWNEYIHEPLWAKQHS